MIRSRRLARAFIGRARKHCSSRLATNSATSCSCGALAKYAESTGRLADALTDARATVQLRRSTGLLQEMTMLPALLSDTRTL